ncbi:MAG: hydrogenase maturation nickel metallochaperone HypA [Acidobacteriaceae bacterium]|nr:hydrogenase maturation nickel metallochaperone HypA [Acidobacteriaceae bacterium]MBV8572712.1 hydrogenase maturation nickel metallochaperone HypA [Acidobacteriaceae bacterium]
MHELSIALSLMEGVEEEISRRPGARVSAVHLRLGALAGVVKDALLFSYQLACEGTPLEGSTLEIEEIPVALYCTSCGRQQPAVSVHCLCCAVCGTPSSDIKAGLELEVFALELMEEHAPAPG